VGVYLPRTDTSVRATPQHSLRSSIRRALLGGNSARIPVNVPSSSRIPLPCRWVRSCVVRRREGAAAVVSCALRVALPRSTGKCKNTRKRPVMTGRLREIINPASTNSRSKGFMSDPDSLASYALLEQSLRGIQKDHRTLLDYFAATFGEDRFFDFTSASAGTCGHGTGERLGSNVLRWY